MITFKQFLKEDTSIVMLPEECANLIKKECAYFLKESNLLENKNLLFRGVPYHVDHKCLVHEIVNKDRQPKDMNLKFHNIFNDIFFKNFGTKFRSESVFTTGDDNEALNYGKIAIVFPIGKFKYLWSTKITDLYVSFDNYNHGIPDLAPEICTFNKFVDKNKEIEIPDIRSNTWINACEKYFTEKCLKTYKTKKLDNAIASKHEIMIACDSYYVIVFNADKNSFCQKVLKKLYGK